MNRTIRRKIIAIVLYWAFIQWWMLSLPEILDWISILQPDQNQGNWVNWFTILLPDWLLGNFSSFNHLTSIGSDQENFFPVWIKRNLVCIHHCTCSTQLVVVSTGSDESANSSELIQMIWVNHSMQKTEGNNYKTQVHNSAINWVTHCVALHVAVYWQTWGGWLKSICGGMDSPLANPLVTFADSPGSLAN
jgi:hypothetical protein